MSKNEKSKKLSPKKNIILYYTQSGVFLAYFSEFPYIVVVHYIVSFLLIVTIFVIFRIILSSFSKSLSPDPPHDSTIILLY